MSWMDSWSRPSKSQATPAPFYLLPGSDSQTYCHACGRVISKRKATETAASSTPAKFCSSRCRHQKPRKLDREIEQVFVKLLNGEEQVPDARPTKVTKKKRKGDDRILIHCDTVDAYIFGTDTASISDRDANIDAEGMEKGVATTDMDQFANTELTGTIDLMDGLPDREPVWKGKSQHLTQSLAARPLIRPPQAVSEVNGSVGGEKGWAERIEESEQMLEKRLQGQKRARQREMVRCAARRGVVFGFIVGKGADGEDVGRRKCEAVMQGKVVEPSFAKGDWSIRWRDEQ